MIFGVWRCERCLFAMPKMSKGKTIAYLSCLGLACFVVRKMANGNRWGHFGRSHSVKRAVWRSGSRKIPTQVFNQKSGQGGVVLNVGCGMCKVECGMAMRVAFVKKHRFHGCARMSLFTDSLRLLRVLPLWLLCANGAKEQAGCFIFSRRSRRFAQMPCGMMG